VCVHGSGQPYIYGICGREITKFTVIYGVFIVCFGREITKYTVIYGVFIVCFGREITKYTVIYSVCIYLLFSQPYMRTMHASASQ